MTNDDAEFKSALLRFISASELSGVDHATIITVLRSPLLDLIPPAPSPLSSSDFPELSELSEDVITAMRKAVSAGMDQHRFERDRQSRSRTGPCQYWEAGARSIVEHVLFRDNVGTIVQLCGVFLNPEDLAVGKTSGPAVPLYRVAFDQASLWPSYRGPPSDKLCIEIYDHWLELAANSNGSA